MEDLFSILLIEDRIAVAVAVSQVISRHLPSYRLTICRRPDEAAVSPVPAHVILLGAPPAGLENDTLPSVLAAYPGALIILLAQAVAGERDEAFLLTALAAGPSDYAALSEVGLLALGRRLSYLQAEWHRRLGQVRSAAKERARLAATLQASSRAMAETWGTRDAVEVLLRQLVQLLETSGGFLVGWRTGQEQGTVLAELASGASPTALLKPGDSPALLAGLARQQPVALPEGGAASRLLLPLSVKGEVIGWIELYDTRRSRRFSEEECVLAMALANQAAVALQSWQQRQQARQALHETEALYRVASALATTQDAQTIMSVVLQEYLHALDLKQGSIIIFDFAAKYGIIKVNFRDNQAAPAGAGAAPAGEADPIDLGHAGAEGYQIPLKNNRIYERLMRTYQPLVIDDTRTSPLLTNSGDASLQGWAGPGALSMLVLPLQVRGEITGAMVVEATGHRRPFEAWDIALGQAMTDQLGLALMNVQLYAAEHQRRQQAETLREVSFVVGSSLNLREVLEHILDQLRRVIKYDSAAIHLIEGPQRRIIAGRGFPYPDQVLGMTFPITLDEEEPGSVAIHTRQPVVIGNVAELYPVFREAPHQHIKSWMGIPLIARGQVIGLISIDQMAPNAFNREDVELAQAFANQVAVALENARLHELEVRELEHELEIAQGIQEALLPQFVPQVPGLQICGRLLPARQIGGDFFHFFAVNEEQLGVAIGDVSGKGIPAALYMAVAITAIDINIRNRLPPAGLLNQLNQNLYNRLRSNKMSIGLQVAVFSPLSHHSPPAPEARAAVVTVASAGMIAPVGATPHGCRFLPVSGLPLGALPSGEITYPDEAFLLDPFTTVIFTSDGIVEARNQAGELFGFDRLEATVNEVVASRDAEIIAEHIIHTAQLFIGEAEQHDDMTVVVVVKV